MRGKEKKETGRVKRSTEPRGWPYSISLIISRVAAVGSAFYGLCLVGLAAFVGADRPERDYGKGVQAAAEWVNGARNGPGCRLFWGA
jgi:hypothetical protein